jgi:hypothetical protein
MPWVQELIDIIKRQRKHAGFFEWPQKDTKELGVVKCLLESLEKAGGCSYFNPRSAKKDPPDCVAQDKSGNMVGIEVSELVDLKTVRDAQQNKAYPKYWDRQAVLNKIQSIISKKDQKKFRGGPYSSIVLVIFTDETFLDPDDVIPYLQQHEFAKTNQVDEIYLLFSYDPRYHTYPFCKLRTADKNRINSD